MNWKCGKEKSMFWRIVSDVYWLGENMEGYYVEYSKDKKKWKRQQTSVHESHFDMGFTTLADAENFVNQRMNEEKLKQRGPQVVKEF